MRLDVKKMNPLINLVTENESVNLLCFIVTSVNKKNTFEFWTDG